jgi:hypothetical protein
VVLHEDVERVRGDHLDVGYPRADLADQLSHFDKE